MRKIPLVENKVYHIFTKSIAGFKIFRSKNDYRRMVDLIRFYRLEKTPTKFSVYIRLKDKKRLFDQTMLNNKNIVDIIAYCLMPTHIHLILSPLKPNGISIFMSNILNSYTRYFNNKTNRKGPLWQSRFKNVDIQTDEQHYHLTRYIHLNPVSDGLVKKPEHWIFSSYHEYIDNSDEPLCNFRKYLDIEPKRYMEFVNSRIEYQKELRELKKLYLE